MGLNTTEFLVNLVIFFIPFLFALSFHELAHGWVAYKLGDNTAQLMGRLSMNPLAHADLVGTFVLPGFFLLSGIPFLFGYAKPVPVNPRNLKEPKKDMFWIAIAGPLSNVLLGLIGFILMVAYLKMNPEISIMPGSPDRENPFFRILDFFIIINIVLAVFNMLPLHPLDGGKVLARFLPNHANQWLENNQMILQGVLLILIISGFFRYLIEPIYIAATYALLVIQAL